MKNTLLLLALVVLVSLTSLAQLANLIPQEVKNAYKNGTRNIDGIPGPMYWQNSADYKIDAVLDAKTSTLKGEATINYFNNSPDSLDRIILRLYQNFYRKGNARGWSIGDVDLGEGMVIDSIRIDDGIKSTNPTATNLVVKLESTLNPGDSAQIFVKWHLLRGQADY